MNRLLATSISTVRTTPHIFEVSCIITEGDYSTIPVGWIPLTVQTLKKRGKSISHIDVREMKLNFTKFFGVSCLLRIACDIIPPTFGDAFPLGRKCVAGCRLRQRGLDV
jgi:hypothetical protein